MAFVFKSPKNLELISKPKSKIKLFIPQDNEKEKELDEINQKKKKSGFVPFLSSAEKLFEKVKQTPGPGQYNIQNEKNNFMHRQYIKKNAINYKESLNDVFNLMNNFYQKIEDNKRTPGPGDYNPGENINFGAKAKKQNNFRNSLLLHHNENMIKNMIFIKNLENDKNISLQNSKNKTNYDSKKNNLMNNFNYFNLKRIKKFGSTNNKLFKKLLLTYSQYQDEGNNISNKTEQESINSKEAELNSLNLTKNFNSTYSQLSLQVLKKNNSTTNVFTKNKKATIYKSIHDQLRIKEISEQRRLDIKSDSEKSNDLLDKYLGSKMFSQPPGPGYYFSRPPPTYQISNSTKNDGGQKILMKKILAQESFDKKNLDENIEVIREKPKTKKMQLSKTMYELKNDLIKKDFKKVKEAYIRNKYFLIMDKLIKMQELQDKEKLKKNRSNKDMNNNKEIQESGYPIKYNKHITKSKKNKLLNFNSKEPRFIGPSGSHNEIVKNINPGPGQYETDYTSISKKNQDILSFNLFKGYQIPCDRKLFTDEIKEETPPVGSYQSQILNSIEYNNNLNKSLKCAENPIKDGFQELIKIKTKKNVEEIKLNEKNRNNMLGPCSYFYNSNNIPYYNKINKASSFSLGESKIKENKIVTNIKMKKELNKKINLPEYKDKYNNWIKKTYNMSFV